MRLRRSAESFFISAGEDHGSERTEHDLGERRDDDRRIYCRNARLGLERRIFQGAVDPARELMKRHAIGTVAAVESAFDEVQGREGLSPRIVGLHLCPCAAGFECTSQRGDPRSETA